MSIPATTWTTAYASALADPADKPAFLARRSPFATRRYGRPCACGAAAAGCDWC